MSKSNNNIATWAIIAIIALLGLNGYQYFVNSQLKAQNNQNQTELLELEKVNAELDQDYQAALSSLEDMRGDNKELNALIDSQKKELANQKSKINNLIWSKRELGKAREEIQNLKTQAETYIAKVSKLQKDNARLTTSNTKLKKEKEALTVQYQQVEQARVALAEEKQALTVQKKKLTETNTKLSSKVDMANAIKINWMEVTGYQIRKNGKRRKKTRARKIDVLDLCFRTETNMVVPSGNKIFQVRIINPQGETIAIENEGSGVLTNKLDNTKTRYTFEGELEYNNEDTEGCMAWQINEINRLGKGEYEVEMYNNGFPVGKGSFKLK